MLKELANDKWMRVFQYAGAFTRDSVDTIAGQVEGSYKKNDWLIWGKLHDGRWFAVRAGTRGGVPYRGRSDVASTEGDIRRSAQLEAGSLLCVSDKEGSSHR